jgi:hypothetical protein
MKRWERREEKRAAFFEKIRQELAIYAPEMIIQEKDNALIAQGPIPLYSEEKILDRFDAEIRFFNDFPRLLPEVRVLGKRIDVCHDNHFTDNGIACLEVPENLLKDIKTKEDIHIFLWKFVNGFFEKQYLKEKTGSFGDHWEHGAEGRLAYYFERFPIAKNDPKKILKLLEFLLGQNIKGHQACPFCGTELRNCHLKDLCSAKEDIPKAVLKDAVFYARIFIREQEQKVLENPTPS